MFKKNLNLIYRLLAVCLFVDSDRFQSLQDR